MPTPLPSPDAPPSQGGPVEIPSWIQTYLAHGDEEQRAIAQDALDALMAATICLHCNQKPATKAENDKSFTLCDGCYFEAGLDGLSFMAPVPPRTAQDRLIAAQTAEILRLTRELAAARNALIGGS